MPFTDKQISALRPKGARYEVREPGRTGLVVRVSPHGVKSWVYRYRFHGAHRRMCFGLYPDLGVAEVRLKWADAQKQVKGGADPGAQVSAARAAIRMMPTVDDMVGGYLRHAADTMKPNTVKEDRRILGKEILPQWRGRLAKEITRQDVMALLNAIQERGVYVMRNRVAGVLSRLFLFALDEGMIDASPAIKLRRLKKVKNTKVEQPRSHFLTKEEIRDFWHGLDTIPITAAMRAAFRWALVTGQRRSEIAGTLRTEIDDAAALWRIPPERTKNEQEQLLPLPALALTVLAEADAARIRPQPTRLNRKDRTPHDATPSPWLFPSKRYGKPITAESMTCALNRHRKALKIGAGTVHDLRRSFATWLGELGTEKDLVSALLNHAPKGVTDVHYNRATLLQPKRTAMERWSAWLSRVIAGESVAENVVSISRARRGSL